MIHSRSEEALNQIGEPSSEVKIPVLTSKPLKGPAVGVLTDKEAEVGRESPDEETARVSGELDKGAVSVLTVEEDGVKREPANDEQTARETGEVVMLTEEEAVVGREPASVDEVSWASFLTQIRARHLKGDRSYF